MPLADLVVVESPDVIDVMPRWQADMLGLASKPINTWKRRKGRWADRRRSHGNA